MGRTKKEQQQESLKQNPVNETPEDGDSAEYEEMPDQSEQIMQTGSVTVTKAKHVIHCLTIVGQIEGHYILPPQNKTTKYEHVIPQLVAIEQDPSIEGLMIILNTVGGDVEAGLAIAELISGMKKPTVSLVLGGGHSIGVPLACSARQSFIAPSATMTVHPVRMLKQLGIVIDPLADKQPVVEQVTGFFVTLAAMKQVRKRIDARGGKCVHFYHFYLFSPSNIG